MALLVTSASGANGNGFGALLAFELDGRFLGTFIEDDRIADPRGLAIDPKENLLFLNSGADRVLAISSQGRVVRDTGRIEGLNPGGGSFGPDGRYLCLGLSRDRNGDGRLPVDGGRQMQSTSSPKGGGFKFRHSVNTHAQPNSPAVYDSSHHQSDPAIQTSPLADRNRIR